MDVKNSRTTRARNFELVWDLDDGVSAAEARFAQAVEDLLGAQGVLVEPAHDQALV